MSGGVVYRRAVAAVEGVSLDGVADRELFAALEAAHKGPLLQLLYEAAHEAELARDDLLDRAAGCYLSYAAGNLADDLIDGDCDYLDDAIRLGPSTQFLLQNAAYRTWLCSDAPRDALRRCAEELARAAGPNHLEVKTERWTAERFQYVGEAITGRQWGAYLEVLWGGTPLAARASAVGVAMGSLGHLVEDVRTEDARWTTLTEADQVTLRAWALDVKTALAREPLRFLAPLLRGAAAVLGEEFAP